MSLSVSAPRVVIGTPTAGGVVKTSYLHTVVGTLQDLARHGIDAGVFTFDGSDLPFQRNIIASYALAEPRCTHVLFIDSDMSFDPKLCRRLLATGKDVVGGVYPKKALDLKRLEKNLDRAQTFADALALSLDFNVVLRGSALTVEDGLAQVEAVGTGAMLIRRQVLETMVERSASRPVKLATGFPVPFKGKVYDFFDQVPGPSGERLSEDYSFCRKWTETGGEVWALMDAAVGHVGDMTYAAPFMGRLQAMQAAGRAARAGASPTEVTQPDSTAREAA